MARTERTDDWIGRVLGIDPGPLPGGGVSVRALGAARLTWIGVRRQAASDLARLGAALKAEFAGDATQASALGAAMTALDDRIDRLGPKLETDLDAVLNAPGLSRAALAQAARALLSETTGFLATDPVMAAMDHNEVLPDLVVVAPLRTALGGIAAALG